MNAVDRIVNAYAGAGDRSDAVFQAALQLRDAGLSAKDVEDVIDSRLLPTFAAKSKKIGTSYVRSVVGSVFNRTAREGAYGAAGSDYRPAPEPPAYSVPADPAIEDPVEREALRMLEMDPAERKAHADAIEDDELLLAAEDDDENFDLSEAAPFPDSLYELLPPIFAAVPALFDEPGPRDAFFLASLTVFSAAAVNVAIPTAYRRYAPSLFFAISAPPGSGKAAVSVARRLAADVVVVFDKENQRQAEDYASEVKHCKEAKAPVPPKPTPRRFIIPANSSGRQFLDMLEANAGRGLVIEEEIYSLTQNSGQEWGNYREVLLKGAEQEPLTLARSDAHYRIDRPRPSVCLAGTPSQIATLIPSIDDGLLSRFLIYYFPSTSKFKSMRPGTSLRHTDELTAMAADEVHRLFRALDPRVLDLVANLSDELWDRLHAAFEPLEARVRSQPAQFDPNLISVVRRAYAYSVRIAVLLSLIRAAGNRADLRAAEQIEVQSADVDAAIIIASTCLDHALRFAPLLPKGDRIGQTTTAVDTAGLLEALPDRFDKKILFETAEAIGLTNADAVRMRRRLIKSGQVVAERYGWSEKKAEL
jgi:hypothetical protein